LSILGFFNDYYIAVFIRERGFIRTTKLTSYALSTGSPALREERDCRNEKNIGIEHSYYSLTGPAGKNPTNNNKKNQQKFACL